MTLNPSTRRVNQRHEVQLPVDVLLGDQLQAGTIQNMSVGGLYFHCSFPVQRGQLFSVRFSIPTLDVPIEVEVVARWTEKVDDATYGVGVQFLGLKAREVWALTKFFASLATF